MIITIAAATGNGIPTISDIMNPAAAPTTAITIQAHDYVEYVEDRPESP